MNLYRTFVPLLSGFLLFTAACAPTTTVKSEPPKVTLSTIAVDKELPQGSEIMTQAELQSELMSFADRYAVVLAQAFYDFNEQNPPAQARFIAIDDTAYSSSAAFTIAAGPNPEVALLDMVVLTTLGRMIYEEHWRKEYGEPMEYMVNGFRKLEADIWAILAKVSTPDYQQELHNLINQWRADNPGQLIFTYMRFGDFASARQKSTLVEAAETGGVFASVQEATQQVEQTRLLAERSIYLATRLPLLTGTFGDIWLSQWSRNPDLQRVFNNFDKFAVEAKRLVDLAEQLPGNITKVQQAAVTQTMDRFAVERKKTIEEFVAEEERLGGILSEMRVTLAEGNKLVTAVHSLTEQLNLGETSAEGAQPSEPFDINAYRETIAEANISLAQLLELAKAVEQLHQLPGWENILPRIDTTIDRVGVEGEQVIDHTFKQVLLLILVWMVAYFVVRLAVHFLFTKKSN